MAGIYGTHGNVESATCRIYRSRKSPNPTLSGKFVLNSTTYKRLIGSRCNAVRRRVACAANRDGNSEDSPIFYREFVLLFAGTLASACQAVMSNGASGELGWTRRCVAADRGLISTTRGCLRDRSASQDRQRRRAVTNEARADSIVAQLPPALARRINSLARRADVFEVGVTAAEPQAVIVTKDEDFAASCS